MKASRNWCWLFWMIGLGVAILDLGTKAWVTSALAVGESRAWLAGSVRLYHLPEVNRGAFLALGNHWGPTANYVFGGVSAAVIVVLAGLHTRPTVRHSACLSAALGCIFGGAAGNLHDRFRFGGVRDFLQLFLPLGSKEYVPFTAVFNLADTALLTGALLLLLASWFAPLCDAKPNSQDRSAAGCHSNSI
ncbi:Lipoprotein signal peptidase [bacterium HR36]|nr:Lipoprotein signal peptidase [bacterium HR36]